MNLKCVHIPQFFRLYFYPMVGKPCAYSLISLDPVFFGVDINKRLVAVKNNPLYLAALKYIFPCSGRIAQKGYSVLTCFRFMVPGNILASRIPLVTVLILSISLILFISLIPFISLILFIFLIPFVP